MLEDHSWWPRLVGLLISYPSLPADFSLRGGAIVYRFAQYFPDLVTHVFSICTPYSSPQQRYVDLHTLVSTRLPNFRYQLDFASGAIEEAVQSKREIRAFLNGAYGGRSPNGEFFFTKNGVQLDRLPLIGSSPLLTERELDFYVSEFARHGIHGPLNWYRTREVNFVDELELIGSDGREKRSIQQPVLFVQARRDAALPPSMSERMEARVPFLTRRDINTNHWALWEKPDEINTILREWLLGVTLGSRSKL